MIQERLESISLTGKIMSGFAERTGLAEGCGPPRRYLWTNAFAVCNFLELYRESGEERNEEFWLRPSSQKSPGWQAHQELDSVMLENDALPATGFT